MMLLARLAVMAVILGVAALGQERTPASAHPPSSVAEKVEHVAGEGSLEGWKWANFLILTSVLAWLIAKNAPQFFRSRTEEIQRGIAEASRVREEAEARASKMEARMASLQSEIEHVRAEAKADMAREAAHLRSEMEKQLSRIQAQGEQEIASIAKNAQKELRTFSAQLAIQLAKQRILGRMSGETQNALVDDFLRRLHKQAPVDGVRN